MEKITVPAIRQRKGGDKITMLTAYDFVFAGIVDQAGIDIILVGDSVGNVMLGYPNTLPVTVDEMIHHTKAVVRQQKAPSSSSTCPSCPTRRVSSRHGGMPGA